MINEAVCSLVAYALRLKLIEKEDVIYALNTLLVDLGLDSAEYEIADIEKLAEKVRDRVIKPLTVRRTRTCISSRTRYTRGPNRKSTSSSPTTARLRWIGPCSAGR